MILYHAGSMGKIRYEQIASRAGANHSLFSFANTAAQQCAEYLCTRPPVVSRFHGKDTQRRIFIDSGAYSVWHKGKKVDLGDYITFCKRIMGMAKCPVVFAALDVIPGDLEDRERACAQGWANYQTMKQEGIPCLMTFHQFEHIRWLTRIADDSNYFAVSPRKDGSASKEQKWAWLQSIFRYIQPLDTRNGEVTLKKRIHGLGICCLDWMKQLPFFSVDNTTWVKDVTTQRHRVAGRSRTLQQWEQLARECKMPTRYLRQMLGFGKPGALPDPKGNSGSYWLMYLSMSDCVETERRVTAHWRDKGLILDHSA
jgi:hypothetical protein